MRLCPEKADQDGDGPQGQDLGGVAEATWFVHPGEKKTEDDLMAVYTFLTEDSGVKSADLLCLVASA